MWWQTQGTVLAMPLLPREIFMTGEECVIRHGGLMIFLVFSFDPVGNVSVILAMRFSISWLDIRRAERYIAAISRQTLAHRIVPCGGAGFLFATGKTMKKWHLIGRVIATVFFVGVSIAQAEMRATAGSKQYMTQGELAKRVAFISGIADAIPNPVSGEAAAQALSVRGWTPIEGWRVGAVATKEDFYVVMAKYLGLKPKNPDDPKSYLEALSLAGFSFGGKAAKSAPKSLEERDPTITRLVIDVKGFAEFREGSGGMWSRLGKLQLVKEGMSFRTGKDGQIDVVYVKGAAQRIFENSELTIEMLRQDLVNNQPVRAVVVYITRGEVVSIVEPMNKASQFVLRDPLGKFEVDRAAGCKFNARVAEEQSITLNRREIRMANGWKLVVEIQQKVWYTVITGGAQYFSSLGGGVQNLGPGQTAVITLQAVGAGGQVVNVTLTTGSATALANIVAAVQQAVTLFNQPPPMANESLMTMTELNAMLNQALGGGQSVNFVVTPIK